MIQIEPHVSYWTTWLAKVYKKVYKQLGVDLNQALPKLGYNIIGLFK